MKNCIFCFSEWLLLFTPGLCLLLLTFELQFEENGKELSRGYTQNINVKPLKEFNMSDRLLKLILILQALAISQYTSAAYIAMETPQLNVYTEAGFAVFPNVISNSYNGPITKNEQISTSANADLIGTTDAEGNDRVAGVVSGDSPISDDQWRSHYVFVESNANFNDNGFSFWVHGGADIYGSSGSGPEFDEAYSSRFAYSSSSLTSVFSVVGGDSSLQWDALAFSAPVPEAPVSLIDLTEGIIVDTWMNTPVQLLENHRYSLTMAFDLFRIGDYDILTSVDFEHSITVPEPMTLPMAGCFLGLLLCYFKRSKKSV